MLEGGKPVSMLKREGETEKEGKRTQLPFSWELQKMLCSTTRNVPQIFHTSASLSSALGIRVDHREEEAAPEAELRQEVLQDEKAGRNITKNIM